MFLNITKFIFVIYIILIKDGVTGRRVILDVVPGFLSSDDMANAVCYTNCIYISCTCCAELSNRDIVAWIAMGYILDT